MKRHQAGPTARPAAAAGLASPGAKAGGLRSTGHWPWVLGLMLVAATFAAYWPALRGGFIWDDDAHLTQNPCVVGPLGLKEIWTSRAARICPLVQTTFWVEHRFWGLRPLPYHLVNVLMHGASAVVLWRVLRRLKVPGAWLGAALWSLHPVQVETVAWVTELKNTQSALFFLLAILFFARSVAAEPGAEGPDRGRARSFYGLALVWGLLAMASKSSTVILPLVLGLCAWWQERRWRWGNVLKLAPFFLMAVAASAVSVWTQRLEGAVEPEWERSWAERLIVAGKVVWFYLGKLAWPQGLTFIYPRWAVDATQAMSYVPVLAVVLVLGVLWWQRGSWGRPGFFGFGYFLAALLPVLGLVDHFFLRYSFVGDHFQYLASLGALAGAGTAVAWGLNRPGWWGRAGGPALQLGLLLALGILTWRQCGMYRDSETLWRTTLARNPDCWMAHNNLGLTLVQQGRLDDALAHFRKVFELNPGHAEAHINLGNALAAQGKLNEAIQHYELTLQLKPDYAKAHLNLGLALAAQGKGSEATGHYERALQLEPDLAEAHYELGVALAARGKLDEAVLHFQQALQLKPDYANACYNLGVALAQQGKLNEAIPTFERALRLKPDIAEAHGNLGIALAKQGKLAEARQHFQQALSLATAQGNGALAEAFRTRLQSLPLRQ